MNNMNDNLSISNPVTSIDMDKNSAIASSAIL